MFWADPFSNVRHAAAHLLDTVNLGSPDLPDLWCQESEEVLIQPGSGSPAKCWPWFTELAAKLDSVRFILGPAEGDFRTPFPVLRNRPLRELTVELCRCRGYVGNDSGITHLAAYLGGPTVALFGPTDPALWGPIGRRVTVLRKHPLASIGVDDVVEAVRRLRD